jgi:restriction system protein
MARRNRDAQVFKDLFAIAAKLPWWVGTLLAVVAYVGLHAYAVSESPTGIGPEQVGQVLVGRVTRMLASIGQYVIPLVLLAGAAASVAGRRKRKALIHGVATGSSGNVLGNMTWQDFELLVGEAFRRRGFSVAETGGGGADGGIDLTLRKGGELFLVQCKQWRAYKVSVNVVRELFGVMAAQGAAGGFVVTSGVFTADARSFAKGRNIELIDGIALQGMIVTARATRPAMTVEDGESNRPKMPSVGSPTGEPLCPRCGSPMVKRTARQGANAGSTFWGCTTYPKCRGTQAIN